MKSNKYSKGITLISLVITIVIMLILAGVSINLIIGNNGLFSKSKTSADTYKEKAKDEESQINSLDYDSLLGTKKDEENNVPEKPQVVDSDMKDDLNQSCVFKGSTRSKVTRIIIESLNTNPQEPTNYIAGLYDDLSKDSNKSVLGYYTTSLINSSMYDFHIIGKGKLKLPADCSLLFSEFNGITSITGFENLDTTNVTNMNRMFYDFGYNNANSLSELDLGNEFDTSNVTNFEDMFAFCCNNSLKKIILGNKFNTSNATNLNGMFRSCGRTKLEEIYLGNNFNLKDGVTTDGIFNYMCSSAVLKEFSSNKKDIVIKLFNTRTK